MVAKSERASGLQLHQRFVASAAQALDACREVRDALVEGVHRSVHQLLVPDAVRLIHALPLRRLKSAA